ncbi:hypothetical protein PMIN06_001835 [Paraphaeosphaeria minitans]|uniref:non-specific serine/threonine protein kinase n=1 Tax=Paraphaeosphaeria minitans TaxID=565426 RepID=A0A9P6GK17_9PLEO|nr:g2-specific protein kinase nima [Paraphaeosphaeria minitans]
MPHSRSSFSVIRHLTAEQDGGFNQGILLVKHRRTAALYIEKRISPRAIRTGHAAREACALRTCHHPHIISLVFADLNAAGYGFGSIYMSYCELGSLDGLLSRLARRSTFPPEGFLWKMLFDMATALCYLQTGLKSSSLAQRGQPVSGCATAWDKILHRDIKPANIFLTFGNSSATSGYPALVLGDFGASLMGRDKESELMTAFTKPFAPPEEPRYSDTSDVYSLALSVYCVAALRGTPSRRESVRADPAPGYSRELRGVLGRMLRTMPGDRVEVGYLPYLVWREMTVVKRKRAARGLQGESLPSWALGE